MSDRDVPMLRFSSAVLGQRLLEPMARVLRVACTDLGVVPVVGLGLHEQGDRAGVERAGARELEPERSANARVAHPAGSRSVVDALGPAEVPAGLRDEPRLGATASRTLDAAAGSGSTPEAVLAAAERAAGAPASLAASRLREAAPGVLDSSPSAREAANEPLARDAGISVATVSLSAAGRSTTEPSLTSKIPSHPIAGRVRLRPRPPGELAEQRPAVGEDAGSAARSVERGHEERKVRIRALPRREEAGSTPRALASTASPTVDPIVTARSSTIEPSTPEHEPLVLAPAIASSRMAARGLVPVTDAVPEHSWREAAARIQAPRSHAPRHHAPQPHARSFDASWTDEPPRRGSPLVARDPVSFDAPSPHLGFVSTPTHPPTASSLEPAPRVVSLDAPASLLPTSSAPSHAISEHALASVIAAAARRHGIDT